MLLIDDESDDASPDTTTQHFTRDSDGRKTRIAEETDPTAINRGIRGILSVFENCQILSNDEFRY